jgi:hypothetical protein
MEPKVLLCSPINIVKEYCLYRWLSHINKLSYFNLEIFLVDNSPNPAFSQKIRGLGFNCVHEPPKDRETRDYMARSLQRCQTKFLSGDYTHFFSLECDVFPPLDIIERLLKHNLEVVGTTYWTEQGFNTRMQLRTIYNSHTDFKKHVKEYKSRFLTFEETQLFIDGQVNPIYANGIGCTLIERSILEVIKFRIDPKDIGYPDTFFHTDLFQAGIQNYVDTSIIPEHMNSSWNTILSDTVHKIMQVERGDLNLKK